MPPASVFNVVMHNSDRFSEVVMVGNAHSDIAAFFVLFYKAPSPCLMHGNACIAIACERGASVEVQIHEGRRRSLVTETIK